MKNNAWILKLSWPMLLLALAACFKGQENGARPNGPAALESSIEAHSASAVALGRPGFLRPETTQVSEYIRRIFQDEAGNIWFGTNDDGVVRYDGNALHYYSVEQGFAGRTVRGIVQDRDGYLWLATSGGISRYDGKSLEIFPHAMGYPVMMYGACCWTGRESFGSALRAECRATTEALSPTSRSLEPISPAMRPA